MGEKLYILRPLKQNWSLVGIFLIFWLIIGGILSISITQNDGHLIYAQDDPYIHLAMAKNFASYGVWGVTKYGFTSTTSSPLWTLLLGIGFFLLRRGEFIAIALNIVFGILLLIVIYAFLKKRSIQQLPLLVVLLCVIFLGGMPFLIFLGQEHILHVFLSILLIFTALKVLSTKTPPSKQYMLLLIMTLLLPVIRYESLFLIGMICLLFILNRKWIYGILIGVSSTIPVILYGLVSLSKGWYLLPNSVLLKGNRLESFSISGFADFIVRSAITILPRDILVFSVFISPILLVFLLHLGKRNLSPELSRLFVIYMGTFILHFLFLPKREMFLRYIAYLVVLAVMVNTVLLQECFKFSGCHQGKRLLLFVIFFIFLLFLIPSFSTKVIASIRTPIQGARNIYEQQYQVGQFLERFYTGESVAIHDIGAMNYLAEIKCLDLLGLGTKEVAEAILKSKYTPSLLSDLVKSKKVKIAVIYESLIERFIGGELPTEWIKVGEWKIPNNLVCGSDTVSFYVTDPDEKNNLIKNLRDFSTSLPPDVVQTGIYLN